uniref:Uncharacterized protein n=1 Tax=Anguilla anguilla TaxID=7936 RepID=A0A0E9V4V2_ANGAN
MSRKTLGNNDTTISVQLSDILTNITILLLVLLQLQ